MITEVTFYPLRPNEKGLIGLASLLFDGKLSLNSIAVYTRPDGSDYRLLFPSKRLPNGKEINLFYPVDRQTYQAIKDAVIGKLEELAKKLEG
jgi:stage V sporulation protein G